MRAWLWSLRIAIFIREAKMKEELRQKFEELKRRVEFLGGYL